MENNLIDILNKILTNTLEYKEVLDDLAEEVSERSIQKKLIELAEIKKKQSKVLMKIISAIGGDVQSSERITDQHLVSWMSPPIPHAGNRGEILNFLVKTEQNARQDYQKILNHKDLDDKGKSELKVQLQKCNDTLKGFGQFNESPDK